MQNAQNKDRYLCAAAIGCLLAALVVSLGLIWPGAAGSAPFKVTVLGRAVANLKPDCPTTENKDCQTLGRVTGFQSQAGDGPVRPYAAPADGKVVSWSISLSRPSNKAEQEPAGDEVAFFNEYFGSPSTARISVLRRVPDERPPQYRLIRQSPIQILNPYFGSTVQFALEHPLSVLQGDMIGITIPTWAPAFFHSAACDLVNGFPRDDAQCSEFSASNSWRASRRDGRCAFDGSDREKLQAQINQSYPQQKPGSEKEYGCFYRGARLLYTATFVKKPQR